MKNIFKWHTHEFQPGLFAARRLSLATWTWVYLDLMHSRSWWAGLSFKNDPDLFLGHCTHHSAEFVQKTIERELLL